MTAIDTPTDLVPAPQAPRRGAGRRPDPNPFLDSVRAIAGTLNDATGQALCARETLTLNAQRAETLKQRSSHVRRKLTAAGKIVAAEHGRTDPYLIGMSISENDAIPGCEPTYTLVFWDREVRA
jgi:hypothetical protein